MAPLSPECLAAGRKASTPHQAAFAMLLAAGFDSGRLGAMLWESFRDGSWDPTTTSAYWIPMAGATEAYTEADVLALLRQIAARDWTQTMSATLVEGWTEALEDLVRAVLPAPLLVERWREVPEPVGASLAFALVRHGRLRADVLGPDVFDRIVASYARREDGSLPNVDDVWPREQWVGALLSALLAPPAADVRQWRLGLWGKFEPYLADATPAQLVGVLQELQAAPSVLERVYAFVRGRQDLWPTIVAHAAPLAAEGFRHRERPYEPVWQGIVAAAAAWSSRAAEWLGGLVGSLTAGKDPDKAIPADVLREIVASLPPAEVRTLALGPPIVWSLVANAPREVQQAAFAAFAEQDPTTVGTEPDWTSVLAAIPDPIPFVAGIVRSRPPSGLYLLRQLAEIDPVGALSLLFEHVDLCVSSLTVVSWTHREAVLDGLREALRDPARAVAAAELLANMKPGPELAPLASSFFGSVPDAAREHLVPLVLRDVPEVVRTAVTGTKYQKSQARGALWSIPEVGAHLARFVALPVRATQVAAAKLLVDHPHPSAAAPLREALASAGDEDRATLDDALCVCASPPDAPDAAWIDRHARLRGPHLAAALARRDPVAVAAWAAALGDEPWALAARIAAGGAAREEVVESLPGLWAAGRFDAVRAIVVALGPAGLPVGPWSLRRALATAAPPREPAGPGASPPAIDFLSSGRPAAVLEFRPIAVDAVPKLLARGWHVEPEVAGLGGLCLEDGADFVLVRTVRAGDELRPAAVWWFVGGVGVETPPARLAGLVAADLASAS